MNFSDYMSTWLKSELTQGRIMVGFGILAVLCLAGILKSNNELLKGALIPMSLLILILIGYGGFILYSRPLHAKTSVAAYKASTTEGINQEKTKHINDNKAGNALMKVYPILAILSLVVLFFGIQDYYKGMAIGFALLFITFYIIDNGFVSRSNAFLNYLETLPV